ncbi:acyl-CoA synthetase [Sphingopyxis panaciterrulae]|uniref:Acyl-CoA synthetase (AMP-forming)/AMP-acid ligase II n=1 Tax=Sphingopyxis panaciterrulae TaxID=462372 RepID=A0A7W9EQR1_9SPHN|nr:acyl-CoA synthetase [Sphingopyxis panaciterrulae]MBB5706769.1 acyl-CoA synthetase (AMP-forming)/AMP-acid ligase II [Sphingopyxis panaciterrulae]
MHPRFFAQQAPAHPAIVMAATGETVSYAGLEAAANRGAQLFRALGIGVGETVAVWLGNCREYFEIYWAAQRAGLYLCPISSHLTAEEAAYILNDSGSRLLVTHKDVPGAASLGAALIPGVAHRYDLESWAAALAGQPARPIGDETAGYHLVYSSGTTGRPKGIRLPLSGEPADAPHMLGERIAARYGVGTDSVILSPAPLYHTAPLAYGMAAHRNGATLVIMDRFDPEATLRLIEAHRVTFMQMVPTMFVRLLALPDAVRKGHDLSSLQKIVHAAAPCPVEIKHRMIEWLGPIIYEYYGGSEGNGSTFITPQEWLERPGSVGRADWGTLHICDEEGGEVPPGVDGLVYFEGGWDFQYLNDPEKTRDARHPHHPQWSTLGDIGHVDADGYLYLTDRKSFMIISGGVNIYPQEVENLLITHPRVADAAVIGVPNAEFGEEVKAVVQPLDPADATPDFAAELIRFCKRRLSAVKCPRSVDFDPALPRLDTGKLYKRVIRDRYWPRAS